MTSIKIGYCLSLTGAFAAYGQSALIAHKIWEEEINKRGGLLGKRVELICVDDKSNFGLVANIYQKLIEEQKVDLIIGGYGVNSVAPAIQLALDYDKYFISLMGKVANSFNCFSMIPIGVKPNTTLAENFFKNIAKNSSVAIISADAELTRNSVLGARENIASNSQRIIFEYNYSLSTFDFIPLAEELRDLNPDAVYIAAYSSDAIGIMKAINEVGFHPNKIGASVVGPLGLRVVCSGIEDLMGKYLSRTSSIEADVLGYYLAPMAYAQLQILEQAVVATNSLNDAKLIGHTHEAAFKTVLGDIQFDRYGECTAPQMIQIQYQALKAHDIEQVVI
jgi:branched-chain amino acid transport system substrate-binding protein